MAYNLINLLASTIVNAKFVISEIYDNLAISSFKKCTICTLFNNAIITVIICSFKFYYITPYKTLL